MSRCVRIAHVKRSDGSIVESKLFKDLLHYTPSRAETKEHYAVATSREFLDMVGDRAEFDENGEITFDSYRDIVGIEENTKLTEILGKDAGVGVYEYDEAVNRMAGFNRSNPYRKSYMATLSYAEDGKYKLSVVKRNPLQESRLEKLIHRQSLQDRIKFYLNRAGVSVKFLEEGSKEGGRYSTENAEQTSNGLYQLIKIAHGEHVTEDLAEEAGHFAIGALGDNPLVARLQSLLTEDVQKTILGDKYDDKVLGNNPSREVAGVLVGQALQNGVDNKMAWQKLANRIAYAAKKIFYKLKGDEVKTAMLEAKDIAAQIAKGFASPNFTGNVETALNTKEVLYSAKPSKNVKTYRDVVQRLRVATKELQSIAKDDFNEMMKSIQVNVEVDRDVSQPGVLGDNLALDGIAEAIYDILDLCGPGKEVNNILDSIDFDNLDSFLDSISENGRKLRQVRVFLNNSLAIQKIVQEALSSVAEEKLTGPIDNINLLSTGGLLSVNLRKILRELEQLNNNLQEDLTNREFQFFSKFLQEYYGEKYITYSTRVVFKKQGGKLVYKPVKVDGTTVTIKDEIEKKLTSMENDIGLYQRYIASMSNNSDLVGQIVDKVVKQSGKTADDITNRVLDDLRVLRENLRKLGYKDTSFLYEIGRDGKLTGNILSDKNWGDWETDRHEFIESEREAFKAATPNLESLSEIEIALKWAEWLDPKISEWNEQHSTYDEDLERYVPNDSYHNDEFDRIIPENSELRKWYQEYMELKRGLDEMLPEGSTLPVRMPQFRGTFVNKMQNRRMFEGAGKAFRHTLGRSIRDTFCETSEDTDYGCLQTYNSEDESLLHNEIEYEKEKMNRIPIYGINKLTKVEWYETTEKDANGNDVKVKKSRRVVDMSDLSTDLFHTTLAYAGMASSYATLSSIVDVLEVGHSVLNERKVAGVKREADRDNDKKSRAYTRYLKFLEKQVYGVSMKKISFGNLVLNKVVGATTRLGAYMFLGGNLHGGMVNLGTGWIEIFKEACAGEEFNLKDWRKANGDYFGSFVQNFGSNISDFGRLDPDNKMALLIRRWDILGENRQNFKEFETRHSWAFNAISKSWFLPYKAGEHYMQSIPYLALANGIKLWHEVDGKLQEISLIDLFEMVDNENASIKGKKGKTLKVKDGIFFKSPENQEQYKMIDSILSKLKSSSLTSPVALTQEEQDYLNNNGIKVQDTDNAIRRLKENQDSLIWTADDEAKFINRAREVTIRLHGIYNNYDKVALSQNIWGNAFLAMKGWALGMAERRFASDHYNISLGHNVEGSITTVLKVWAMCGLDRSNFWNAVRATILPFGKNAEERFMKCGFSANQWRNMKRNFGDYLAIGLLALLKSLTKLPPDDEYDDEYYKALYGSHWKEYKKLSKEEKQNNVGKGLIYYFANRLSREQMALNTIRGFYWEFNTLFDIMPAGFSAVADMTKLIYEFVGAQFADEKNSDFFYQQKKEGRYEKGDPKWKNHLKRITPYYRSEYTFKHPYEASKSFEYGKKLKTR